MTPDSLESLSDLELNEVFAVEVCGWTAGEGKWIDDNGGDGYCSSGYSLEWEGHWIDDGKRKFPRTALAFSSSADAVLPYLEKASHERVAFTDSIWYDKMGDYWTVELRVPARQAPARDKIEIGASHASFARAACLALVKAHKAAKSPT